MAADRGCLPIITRLLEAGANPDLTGITSAMDFVKNTYNSWKLLKVFKYVLCQKYLELSIFTFIYNCKITLQIQRPA